MRLTEEAHSNNGKMDCLGGTTRTEASFSKSGPILIVTQVIALVIHSPPKSFTSWGGVEGGASWVSSLRKGLSSGLQRWCILPPPRENQPFFFFSSFVFYFWMVTGKVEDKISQFLF